MNDVIEFRHLISSVQYNFMIFNYKALFSENNRFAVLKSITQLLIYSYYQCCTLSLLHYPNWSAFRGYFAEIMMPVGNTTLEVMDLKLSSLPVRHPLVLRPWEVLLWCFLTACTLLLLPCYDWSFYHHYWSHYSHTLWPCCLKLCCLREAS